MLAMVYGNHDFFQPDSHDSEYILSALRALLGNITSNVRAVLLGYSQYKIHIKFITKGEFTDLDKECLSIACTEIHADYPMFEVIESIEKSSAPANELVDYIHQHFIFLCEEE